jgi:hypothetical protein
MNYRLQKFLSERMFLIDVCKLSETNYEFKLEENCKNYRVYVDHNSFECICDLNKRHMILCKHIKFVIKKIQEIKENITHSFTLTIYEEINTDNFNNDRNPKYKEYIECEECEESGNDERCDICLENFTGKIIMCKVCKKYFHDKCIYGWLRMAVCCNCPLCRSVWY